MKNENKPKLKEKNTVSECHMLNLEVYETKILKIVT